jgi:hypothetical protein
MSPHIQFHNISIMAKESECIEYTREPENELYSNNKNREKGFSLSKT